MDTAKGASPSRELRGALGTTSIRLPIRGLRQASPSEPMSDNAETVVVCVTGMHRSGTSLTASWLGHCGLALDDGEVYGAAEGNPRGHFEDKQFVDLQAAQTIRHAPQSMGWIYTKRAPLSIDEGFEREARALISARSAAYPFWGWKDPRSVLYLEAWRALIPGLKVLFLWRPCAGIASSLVARAKASEQPNLKISPLRAVQTWRAYNERVLAYKSKYASEALLLPLGSVLEHDRRVFDRICSFLNLELKYKPLADVYEPSLLHAHRPTSFQRTAAFYYNVKSLETALEKTSDTI